MGLPQLKAELRDLEQRRSNLPDIVAPPLGTLSVLDSTRSERAWTRYFAYFIDPTQPHGFGTDVTEQFLDILDNHPKSSYQLRSYDLKALRVDREIQSPDRNIPDIIVRRDGEWFVCIEMKVDAQEGSTQTRKYVDDTHLGTQSKQDFPKDGHHYVYLVQERNPGSIADEFVDINWRSVVEAFEPILTDSRGKYPQRSISQLADFIDTVKQVTGMSEDTYERAQVEKLKLYFEHEKAIEDVEHAVRSVWEETRDSWTETFLRDFRPAEWDESWNCHPTQYGSIYRDSWWLDEDMLPTDTVSIDISLSFTHMIRDFESFKNGNLTFELLWNQNNRYRDSFIERFNSSRWQKRLQPHLQENDIEAIGGPKAFTRKQYTVNKRALPESYFETLQLAFDEHAGIADVVTNILEEIINEAAIEADERRK